MTMDGFKVFLFLGILFLSWPAQLSARLMPSGDNTMNGEMTVALKFIALRANASSNDLPTKEKLQAAIEKMSELWSKCSVRFTLEEYVTLDPSSYSLPLHPKNRSDLKLMRRAFADQARAVFISTGKWDRSGDLGRDGSNAFASLPHKGPQGVVFENWVSSRLLAHEFGHLGGDLDDTTHETGLMNHFVTPKNTEITEQECVAVRSGLKSHARAWLRSNEQDKLSAAR